METVLENRSKEELLKLVSSRDETLADQQRMVDSLMQDSSEKDGK